MQFYCGDDCDPLTLALRETQQLSNKASSGQQQDPLASKQTAVGSPGWTDAPPWTSRRVSTIYSPSHQSNPHLARPALCLHGSVPPGWRLQEGHGVSSMASDTGEVKKNCPRGIESTAGEHPFKDEAVPVSFSPRALGEAPSTRSSRSSAARVANNNQRLKESIPPSHSVNPLLRVNRNEWCEEDVSIVVQGSQLHRPDGDHASSSAVRFPLPCCAEETDMGPAGDGHHPSSSSSSRPLPSISHSPDLSTERGIHFDVTSSRDPQKMTANVVGVTKLEHLSIHHASSLVGRLGTESTASETDGRHNKQPNPLRSLTSASSPPSLSLPSSSQLLSTFTQNIFGHARELGRSIAKSAASTLLSGTSSSSTLLKNLLLEDDQSDLRKWEDSMVSTTALRGTKKVVVTSIVCTQTTSSPLYHHLDNRTNDRLSTLDHATISATPSLAHMGRCECRVFDDRFPYFGSVLQHGWYDASQCHHPNHNIANELILTDRILRCSSCGFVYYLVANSAQSLVANPAQPLVRQPAVLPCSSPVEPVPSEEHQASSSVSAFGTRPVSFACSYLPLLPEFLTTSHFIQAKYQHQLHHDRNRFLVTDPARCSSPPSDFVSPHPRVSSSAIGPVSDSPSFPFCPNNFQLLPNEDVLAVLVKTVFSSRFLPPISGQLICTSYRMIFSPDVPSSTLELGILWTFLMNLWEVPLALIDSITRCSLTGREKTALASQTGSGPTHVPSFHDPHDGRTVARKTKARSTLHSHHHGGGFVLKIVTKDNRRFRVLLNEIGRESQVVSTLRSAAFPNKLFDLFAFKLTGTYATPSTSDCPILIPSPVTPAASASIHFNHSSSFGSMCLMPTQLTDTPFVCRKDDLILHRCSQETSSHSVSAMHPPCKAVDTLDTHPGIPTLISFDTLESSTPRVNECLSDKTVVGSITLSASGPSWSLLTHYYPEKEWEYFIALSSRPGKMQLRLSVLNHTFSVSPTYPKLVVVPNAVTDEMLVKVASFRSKHRFPMFCWSHPIRPGSLWRSSQPKSMFSRCVEDEVFLRSLAQDSMSFQRASGPASCHSQHPFLIVDARPYANACVNKVAGAGFEDTERYYPGCRIEFCSIQNIHHVRTAWTQMADAVNSIRPATVTIPSLYDLQALSPSLLTSSFSSIHSSHSPSCFDDPCHTCPVCRSPHAWRSPAGTSVTHRSKDGSDMMGRESKDGSDMVGRESKDGSDMVPQQQPLDGSVVQTDFMRTAAVSSSSSSPPQRRTLRVDPTTPLWIFSGPCTSPLSTHETSFTDTLRHFASSSWYDQIQLILRASNLTVSRMSIGESVLVHCSDGWDRTAQLTSLAMICLDPYYRSLEGFIVLIEQEFLHAGYQFHLRGGHPGEILRTDRAAASMPDSSFTSTTNEQQLQQTVPLMDEDEVREENDHSNNDEEEDHSHHGPETCDGHHRDAAGWGEDEEQDQEDEEGNKNWWTRDDALDSHHRQHVKDAVAIAATHQTITATPTETSPRRIIENKDVRRGSRHSTKKTLPAQQQSHQQQSKHPRAPSTTNNQQSPVFIQWLDCVYQIMQQFPAAFEFTSSLLDVIAHSIASCLFGTFLMNCERERECYDIKKHTHSIWPVILQHRQLFLRHRTSSSRFNCFRHSRDDTGHLIPPLPPPLIPNTSLPLIPWLSYWLRYNPLGLNPLFKSLTEYCRSY